MFSPRYWMHTLLLIIVLFSLTIAPLYAQDSLGMNLLDGFEGLDSFQDAAFFNSYLLVAANYSGLLVVEDYTSDNPIIINQLRNYSESIEKVRVKGDTVITFGNYINRYNFSNPLNPILLDSNPVQLNYYDFYNFCLMGDDVLFSSGDIGRIRWDDDGEMNIEYLDLYSDYFFEEIYTQGDYLYTIKRSPTNDYYLEIWNFSDPSHVVNIPVPDEINELNVEHLSLNGEYAAAVHDSSLSIISIYPSVEMSVLDTWTYEEACWLRNPKFIGDYIYLDVIQTNNKHLNTFSVNQSNQLTLVDEFFDDGLNAYNSVYDNEKILWIDWSYEITIADISQPENVSLLNNWNPTEGFGFPVKVNDYILFRYADYTNKIQINDFTNPDQIPFADLFFMENYESTYLFEADDSHLLISTYHHDDSKIDNTAINTYHLATFDENDPDLIQVNSIIDTVGVPLNDAIFYGDYLYSVNDRRGELRVYNISDISNPDLVNTVTFSNAEDYFDLNIDSHFIYIYQQDVENNRKLFYIYDLNDPANPEFVDEFVLNDANIYLIKNGKLFLFRNSFQPVMVYSLENPADITLDGFFEFPYSQTDFFSRNIYDYQDNYLLVLAQGNQNVEDIHLSIFKVEVWDISDLSNPYVVAYHTFPGFTNAIFADDKIIATWGYGYGVLDWTPTSALNNTHQNELPQNPQLTVYPNPANPAANISLSLPQSGKTSIKIFDILGREVYTLAAGQLKAGKHQFLFGNSDKLSSGLYFIQAKVGNWRQTEKIIFIK